eukprot:symbB.v1.2.016372.t1/scaffold1243.1/size129491/14
MARELCHRDDRRLRLLCLTWNVGATRPLPSESLEAVLDEARECKGAIDSIDLMLLSFPQEPSPDLCVIGFQETCQLTARRLLADGTEWEAWKKWAEKSVKDVVAQVAEVPFVILEKFLDSCKLETKLQHPHHSSSSRGTPSIKHDVCVTCTSPVLAPDDFAGFFGDWIMKACAEMKLSCICSRPQLGPELPKVGSRLQQQLRQAVISSKVAVCIMNMTKGCEMPPPGYKQRNIPVVPFYDADRYDWKEAAAWKVELPAAYRWGLGPVRYRRSAHEEAKEQLRGALRSALQDLEFRGSAEATERSERGRLAAAAQTLAAGAAEGGVAELSRAEMRLRDSTSQDTARRRAESAADEADLQENALGLDRSDFERAGLVQQKLERTNSMRDINLDSALAILSRGAGQQRDPLAAREGGCQLQLISGNEEVSAELLQGNEPKHRLLAPVKGIMRKAKTVVSKTVAPSAVKQLRLSPEALEERRFRFSVQLLQNHLDGLRSDDVHELITVLKCLQSGDPELVMRSLRLLKAFLEAHTILHDRALQQGMVQSVVTVMRQTPEVDVLTLGVSSLSSVLHGAGQRGLLGPEALAFCGAGQLQAAPAQEDLVTSISRSGGVLAILDGMQRFPACEGLQERGCLCLALLTAGTEDNKVSADYSKGKHQESSVLLRSQSRRLVVRQGLGVAKVCKLFLRSRCKPKSAM